MEKSYTSIPIPSVLCDYVNQSASYLSSVPSILICFWDWGHDPPGHPSGYATDCQTRSKCRQHFIPLSIKLYVFSVVVMESELFWQIVRPEW